MRSPYVPTDRTKAEFLTDLLVRELRDGRHQLIQDLWIYSAALDRILLVPLGAITNYASSPRVFWGIVPPDGPWKWAAVAHDAGYHGELVDVTGMRVYLTKTQADNLFGELMAVPPCDAVARWKRWVMVKFVRRFGTGAYRGAPVDPPAGDDPKAAA